MMRRAATPPTAPPTAAPVEEPPPPPDPPVELSEDVVPVAVATPSPALVAPVEVETEALTTVSPPTVIVTGTVVTPAFVATVMEEGMTGKA